MAAARGPFQDLLRLAGTGAFAIDERCALLDEGVEGTLAYGAELQWLRALMGAPKPEATQGAWAAVRGEYGRPAGIWDRVVMRALTLLARCRVMAPDRVVRRAVEATEGVPATERPHAAASYHP